MADFDFDPKKWPDPDAPGLSAQGVHALLIELQSLQDVHRWRPGDGSDPHHVSAAGAYGVAIELVCELLHAETAPEVSS